MFQAFDALLVLGRENRYYFSKASTSFGCALLSPKGNVYLSDSRYETYLKETLKDFELRIVKKDEFFPAIAEELTARGAKKVAFEDDHTSYAEYLGLKERLKDFTLVRGGDAIAAQRAVKTPEEVELIAASQKLTQKAFYAACDALKNGVTEREIAATIVYEMISGGASEPSFSPIVAFGDNSAKPHHEPGDRRLEKGDAVLMDLGAKLNGYCSDMSRTVFFGEPRKELARIYEIVLTAQSNVLQNIRVGITCHEADSYAREYIKSQGYGADFGHGTGHGVGIMIHEAPSLSPGNEEIIKSGMVITVEPGIYLPGIGGVRIEDMVNISGDTAYNMTAVKKDLTVIK